MQFCGNLHRRGRVAALVVLLVATAGLAGAEEKTTESLSSQELKKAAHDSLWRLKRAMERDGFYSARVALNIWRSNAVDAGMFDAAEYAEYERQIYAKSIQNSIRCFEYALAKARRLEARICLHTWKTHSEAMDEFDPELYERLQEKLSALNAESTAN